MIKLAIIFGILLFLSFMNFGFMKLETKRDKIVLVIKAAFYTAVILGIFALNTYLAIFTAVWY